MRVGDDAAHIASAQRQRHGRTGLGAAGDHAALLGGVDQVVGRDDIDHRCKHEAVNAQVEWTRRRLNLLARQCARQHPRAQPVRAIGQRLARRETPGPSADRRVAQEHRAVVDRDAVARREREAERSGQRGHRVIGDGALGQRAFDRADVVDRRIERDLVDRGQRADLDRQRAAVGCAGLADQVGRGQRQRSRDHRRRSDRQVAGILRRDRVCATRGLQGRGHTGERVDAQQLDAGGQARQQQAVDRVAQAQRGQLDVELDQPPDLADRVIGLEHRRDLADRVALCLDIGRDVGLPGHAAAERGER